MLERLDLEAACQHQTHVGITCHIIGRGGHRQCCENARLVQPDLKTDSFAAIEKPLHMVVEKCPMPVVEPHPFPHAIPQKKAAVIDGHFGLITVNKRAIDIDLNVAVSGMIFRVMGGMGRGLVGHHHLTDLK